MQRGFFAVKSGLFFGVLSSRLVLSCRVLCIWVCTGMGLGFIAPISCRWVCSLVVAHVVCCSYPQGPVISLGPALAVSPFRLCFFFSLSVAVDLWVRLLPLPVSLSLFLSSLALSLSLASFWRSVDGVIRA